MADGYRYSQQAAGNYYFPQHTQTQHSRQHIRNGTPPNNIRSIFNSAETPSPTQSPAQHSPTQNLYGMFNQSHQGQHGRVNGAAGRGMPMMYNFQHQQGTHQHAQHHTNVQQDHAAHATNGAVLGHHQNYSGGMMPSPAFTTNSLQNGHSGTTQGGQAQEITKEWAEQLKAHKESEKSHNLMMEGAPNHFARAKAGENKGLTVAAAAPEPVEAEDEDLKDLGRMSSQPRERQDWHQIDLSGQGLRVLTKPLFNYEFLKELYVASNKLTSLPASIRTLRFLEHLDASHNQLTTLPPELGMCVYLKKLLVFDNQISELPKQLGSLFKLEMLGIEGNPFNPEDKQKIMEQGTSAFIAYLKETAPPPFPPPEREPVVLADGTQSSNVEKFKVFAFNILSDQACTQRLYGHTASKELSWEYRKAQILQEIQKQDADFACLQEIDTDTFKEYFSMKLAYSEYKGVFWPRTRSKTMSGDNAKHVDGCATFYKSNKYILLDKQMIDFSSIAINRSDMKSQADIFNRVMPRDHIGVVSFFENRQTGSRLILVNTHLFWDPAYADVKLVQTAILLDSISKLAERYATWPAQKDKKAYGIADENVEIDATPKPIPEPSKEYSSKTQIPLVICADQNSTVHSSVYELLSKGSVSPNHPDINGRTYGNFTRVGIDHPFSLKSAYSNLDRTPDFVPFTNYTPGFRGVIDHIWYSTNALENTALLGKVDETYMETVPGFPNAHFPSDHLSLMAEFAVKQGPKGKTTTQPDFGTSSRTRGMGSRRG